MSSLQKAKIKVHREKVKEINCLFNPAEYKISESAGYSQRRKVRKGTADNQYTGEYTSSLSLTLYFDITENMGQLSETDKTKTSVRDYTSEISDLLLVEGALHKPPVIEFIWGDLAYKGMLTSLNQEFTYFGLEGNPLRAKLDLTINAVPNDIQSQKSPLESPDRTKKRTITEGMTLWKLAWDEYGDCEKWKEIASYNQLMSPFDISPGQIVKLPALKAD